MKLLNERTANKFDIFLAMATAFYEQVGLRGDLKFVIMDEDGKTLLRKDILGGDKSTFFEQAVAFKGSIKDWSKWRKVFVNSDAYEIEHDLVVFLDQSQSEHYHLGRTYAQKTVKPMETSDTVRSALNVFIDENAKICHLPLITYPIEALKMLNAENVRENVRLAFAQSLTTESVLRWLLRDDNLQHILDLVNSEKGVSVKRISSKNTLKSEDREKSVMTFIIKETGERIAPVLGQHVRVQDQYTLSCKSLYGVICAHAALEARTNSGSSFLLKTFESLLKKYNVEWTYNQGDNTIEVQLSPDHYTLSDERDLVRVPFLEELVDIVTAIEIRDKYHKALKLFKLEFDTVNRCDELCVQWKGVLYDVATDAKIGEVMNTNYTCALQSSVMHAYIRGREKGIFKPKYSLFWHAYLYACACITTTMKSDGSEDPVGLVSATTWNKAKSAEPLVGVGRSVFGVANPVHEAVNNFFNLTRERHKKPVGQMPQMAVVKMKDRQHYVLCERFRTLDSNVVADLVYDPLVGSISDDVVIVDVDHEGVIPYSMTDVMPVHMDTDVVVVNGIAFDRASIDLRFDIEGVVS